VHATNLDAMLRAPGMHAGPRGRLYSRAPVLSVWVELANGLLAVKRPARGK
jgi:hypothetical protein